MYLEGLVDSGIETELLAALDGLEPDDDVGDRTAWREGGREGGREEGRIRAC